jgi:hypothetical protein
MKNKFKNYNLINLEDDEKFIDNNSESPKMLLNKFFNEEIPSNDIDYESEFNVSIIKNNEFENKVNLTFNLTIKCNNILNEVVSIDLDINNTTYKKIINDLCIENL